MGQLLLIPDPRPLDDRLGRDFFREAPERAGVYLMRDAADRVLYVGKAKNLRQRLRNYRTANPDRMPRRHLRLLRQVARIEFQFCPGESAALKRESKLLRSLKPKFNRAGVWPGKVQFLAWRQFEERLEFAVMEVPEEGWRRHGPMGRMALELQGTLCRLLWLAVNAERELSDLPVGWARSRFDEKTTICCGAQIGKITGLLDTFFFSDANEFLLWLETQLSTRTHPFERGAIAQELELLKDFSTKRRTADGQLTLL